MNNKTFFIITSILIISAIISFIAYLPLETGSSSEADLTAFPKTVGEWQAEDIALSERVYALLETKNLIMRNYTNQKGETINCYIIYSQDNRKVAHPPEICLQGEGAAVVEKSALQITDKIKATRLILEKALSQELVVYWYKTGDIYTNDYIKQQLKIALGRMLRKKASAAMIRLAIEIKEANQSNALGLLKSFARLIEPLIQEYAP